MTSPVQSRASRQPDAAALAPRPGAVLARLARRYGFPRHGNPKNVFLCAVYVLLSAQTTLEQAQTAYRDVRRRWPSARALARADRAELIATICSCGLGESRATKLLALAKAVDARERSLSQLHRLSDAEVEAELVHLPGIGVKTARVVAAMSALERPRFAVDTHVWRIAQRLGWIPLSEREKPSAVQADHLEARIPEKTRRQLHACLVALGRDCCRPTGGECERCALRDLCATGRRRPKRPRS